MKSDKKIYVYHSNIDDKKREELQAVLSFYISQLDVLIKKGAYNGKGYKTVLEERYDDLLKKANELEIKLGY